MSSKRKPNLIETDRGKEFYNNIFQKYPKNKNIKPYSRNTSLGSVFAEKFYRTIRYLPKKFVFEKGDGNWFDKLSIITKQYNSIIQSSIKLTPTQTSSKKNERTVHRNLLDERKKIEPKFQTNDLVRVAD